jgi:hypothetical protein
VKTAKHYSIELRSLKDRISEEIVQEFLSGLKFSFIVNEYATQSILLQLDDGTWLPQEQFGDDLATAIVSGGVHTTIATEPATGKVLTIDSIMRMVGDEQVPRDGSAIKGTVEAAFPQRTIMVSTTSGPRFLSKIVLTAEFTRREVPAPATSLYEYARPEGPIRHTIEAVAPISATEAIQLRADVHSPTLDKRTEQAKVRPKRQK